MTKRRYGVRCFVPGGRTHAVIYAVVLREHPGIVKLGRTTRWRQRRQAYDGWNLAAGDGVLRSAVYCVTEEFVDLAALETACLGAMTRPVCRGNEWFRGSLEDATAAIEGVLNGAGLSFARMEELEAAPPALVLARRG